jgi:hypothetical protein
MDAQKHGHELIVLATKFLGESGKRDVESRIAVKEIRRAEAVVLDGINGSLLKAEITEEEAKQAYLQLGVDPTWVERLRTS